MTLSPSDIENFSAALPDDWTLNSVSTSGTLTTLLATHTDRRRLVIVVDQDPPPGEAPTQVQMETAVDQVTPPPWLTTLPSLEGGEVDRFALGIGGVAVNYVAAGDGLAAATWRYSDDQTEAILGALDGGGFAASGFTVVDPDAIRIGATSRDVTANDWLGEVVVGADTFDGETTTSVSWLLRRA